MTIAYIVALLGFIAVAWLNVTDYRRRKAMTPEERQAQKESAAAFSAEW